MKLYDDLLWEPSDDDQDMLPEGVPDPAGPVSTPIAGLFSWAPDGL